MKIFNNLKNNHQFGRAGGFCLGLICAATAAYAMPSEPEVKYVKVPEIRVVEKPVVVRKPVYLNGHDRQQIQCMAENTYFEAGHEPIRGRIAVNNVVMNRAKDRRFPSTPCAVINQRARGVCQFSWKCEGGKQVRDQAAYRRAREIAENVYLGNYGDVTSGAKFYHADYVNPSWSRAFDRTIKIGAHIFYRG
jgi:spore germination cell wall hydrolase CwlJ-like protein